MMTPTVCAVHRHAERSFSKRTVAEIELVAGHGVRGDRHAGATVKHQSRVAKDATQPNLRQVHLLQEELLLELRDLGFAIQPGEMGENVTTRGMAILDLSAGTRLQLGAEAIVVVTGLRNPCKQIENFRTGLRAAVLGRTDDGALIRKTGIMCTVEKGGMVRPNDALVIVEAPKIHVPLEPV